MESKPAYPYPPTVVSQPVVYTQGTPIVARGKRDWSAGLFDCFGDCGGVLCATFFPLCYMYKIYSDAGEGCCDCFCGGLLPLRVKVRTERGIEGSICGDVCASTFCVCCTMVQMGREIKSTQPLV